ncbi:YlbG family protein [Enterococcus bulliens]|uniref:YlbG family protein n=1 Tax=uncultured Enterococcus sp. TaxID=167972 RepID=UPI0025E1A4B2|nr:YlbG family protein [uncultured Enterococcus sp.]
MSAESTFEPVKRRGIVVFVYSLRQVRNLRRYGVVHYVSKSMKYVMLYVNESDVETVCQKIERLHFVREVSLSHRPEIEMNFSEKIGTKQAYPMMDDGFEVEEKNTQIRLAEHV